MEKEIGAIVGKVNDYKICKLCGAISFYEATECHKCGGHDRFKKEGEDVLKYIDAEYEFYKKEGSSEQEIDITEIQVM
jgi:ribosomal protein L40E